MLNSNLIYLEKNNIYISSSGDLYNDEDLDNFDYLERCWRKNYVKFSFQELMAIFPEAVKPARRGVKQKLKFYREKLTELNKDREEYYNDVICPAHFKEQEFLKEFYDYSFDELVKIYERKIKTCVFQLSYLDKLEGKNLDVNLNGVTELEIAEAKSISIQEFYTGKLSRHTRIRQGKCPFHNDSNASFTIYTQENTWWCYGCNQGGSVIDFIMMQQNINFLSAVKFILNK